MRAVLIRGLVLRWIARHPLRSALGVAAVALGVAAYVSSAAIAASVLATASATSTAFAGGADLIVVADGTGLSPRALELVRATSQVASAGPLVSGWVRLGDRSGRRFLLVGVDPAAELAARGAGADRPRFEIVDPVAFALGRGAVLARPLATSLGLGPSAAFDVQGASGVVRLVVAGIADPPGGPEGPAARTAVVPIGLARAILGREAAIDRIDIALVSSAVAADAAAAIRSRLEGLVPSSTRVVPPGEADPTTANLLGVVDVALELGALIALLVGVFLIHHTIAIGVTERSREVGIFRALGATRGQVVGVFCLEALTLGLVGSAIGVGAGVVIAETSLDAFASTISGAYFPADAVPVELPASLAAAGVLAGALVALVAAWRPSRRAAGLPPSDAIRRGVEAAARPGGASRLQPAVALVLLVAAGATALATFPRSGYVALVLLLVGFLLASPSLLVAGARLLAPVLARVFGIPGRLAADELAAHPARASLPAATLAIGLALVVETMGNVGSLASAFGAWIDANIAGDLFVSSGSSAIATAGHSLLEASWAVELRKVEGVAAVTGVRMLRVPFRGTRVMLLGIDVAAYRTMAKIQILDPVHDLDGLLARVQTGRECLVSENFAALYGLAVGDTVLVPATDGEVALAIAGRFPDYTWTRGTIMLERGVLERRLGDRLVDDFSVKLVPGAVAHTVARRIDERLGAGRELVVLSTAELRAETHRLIDDFFALSNAQVAAALAVAFLGIFNSLWIAVVMRRRDLGLLRAVGATRGQVMASIVLQAGVMGAIGSVLGVVGGLAIQWIALARVVFEDTGWTIAMDVPWVGVGVVCVLGVATSALAGVFPARAAARAPIRDAIGHE